MSSAPVLNLIIGQERFAQWVTAGDGYLGSDESAIDLGLGGSESIQRMKVTWPSRRFEYLTIGKGSS